MTKITLSNLRDLEAARAGLIPVAAVRSVEIEVLVDTGAINLAIPEDVAERLGAPVMRRRSVRIASGSSLEVACVGPLEVVILGRDISAEAIVLPRGAPALLGVVQLELLDLVVVPASGEVIANPAHPDGRIIPLLRAG